MTRDATRAFRVVLGFWLFGWFCNSNGFIVNFIDALSYPIHYDAFPAILRSPYVVLLVYLAPLLAVFAFFRPSPALCRPTSVLLTLCALLACVHLETCNDATFVTSFWASLWLVWLAWNGHRKDDAFYLHARSLAQSIVGLMFLGGALGKLTPEHRSGEAFYGLYFRANQSFPYTVLKSYFDPNTIRSIASWFSGFAISAELVLAASPFLPVRFVLAGAAVTMLGMMFAWTFHLASVLSCLFGLLVAAYLLRDGIGIVGPSSSPGE